MFYKLKRRFLIAWRAFFEDLEIFDRQAPFLSALVGKTIISVNYCGADFDNQYVFKCSDGTKVFFRLRNIGLWLETEDRLESL